MKKQNYCILIAIFFMVVECLHGYGIENNCGVRTAYKTSPTSIIMEIGPGMGTHQFEQKTKAFQVVSSADSDFRLGVAAEKVRVVSTEPDGDYPIGWNGPKFSKRKIEVTLPAAYPMKDGKKYYIRVVSNAVMAHNHSAAYIANTAGEVNAKSNTPRYGIREAYMIAPDTLHIMTGAGIDLARLVEPGNVTISSTDDAEYLIPQKPVQIGRRSNLDFYTPEGWPWKFNQRHELFIKLPKEMKSRKTYVVNLNSVEGKPVTCGQSVTKVLCDDRKALNLSIKVNQYGYLPDADKYGYLGMWMGDAGAYDFDEYAKSFEVRDAQTHKVILSGKPELRHMPGQKTETVYKQDLSYEKTYQLDFSALKTSGLYYVAIPGAGRSYPFYISEDVYAEPVKTAMSGVFHQRCGIELKSPYAADGIFRPACHRNMTEFGTMPSSKFHGGDLVDFATDGVKHDFCGGHHDAGDWNPRSRLEYAEWLLLLYEMNPTAFIDKQFKIPEAGNGIPDLLDEVWWSFKVWNSLQDEDGGVRSKIETNGDPREFDVAETDSLREFAFRKEPGASYRYAAMSARISAVWAKLGKTEIAKRQRMCAEKAWKWGEAHLNDAEFVNFKGSSNGKCRDQRTAAAAALLALTRDSVYDAAFRESSVFTTNSNATPEDYNKGYNQIFGSYYYAMLPAGVGDEALKEKIINGFEREFDYWKSCAETTNYRYMRSPWAPNNWGTGALPMWVERPAMTWKLTKDPARKAAARQWILFTNDFSLGCDPMNMCFATYMGRRYVTTAWNILQMVSPTKKIPGLNSNGPCNGYGTPGLRPAKGGMSAWPGMSLYPAGKDSWPQLYQYSEDASPGMNEGCHPYRLVFSYGLFLPSAQ